MTAEVLKIIIMACSLNTTSSEAWLVEKTQLACQKNLITCVTKSKENEYGIVILGKCLEKK